MKNLILILSLCFVLFSCFEKEEEITVVPVEEPVDVNILECQDVQEFIQLIENEPPREPRATIEKYKKGSTFIFATNTGGEPYYDELVGTIYRNTECEIICRANYGVTGGDCTQEFYTDLVLIDTVWVDNR
ncbi:hypothetical protein ACE193_17725 [Bernardetia sp. OM2101]|uniref:hypothetical protein n=1 Tax=Bernardetia sp. OM2101 TaxID=3344876 RepID=UPI0035D0DF46